MSLSKIVNTTIDGMGKNLNIDSRIKDISVDFLSTLKFADVMNLANLSLLSCKPD